MSIIGLIWCKAHLWGVGVRAGARGGFHIRLTLTLTLPRTMTFTLTLSLTRTVALTLTLTRWQGGLGSSGSLAATRR